MTSGTEPIRISRGPGGEVEVTGPCDAFAGEVLRRAGFLVQPVLRGHWIRLPFDMGREWENDHATWAADMLTAARYHVDLDPDLLHPFARCGHTAGEPPCEDVIDRPLTSTNTGASNTIGAPARRVPPVGHGEPPPCHPTAQLPSPQPNAPDRTSTRHP